MMNFKYILSIIDNKMYRVNLGSKISYCENREYTTEQMTLRALFLGFVSKDLNDIDMYNHATSYNEWDKVYTSSTIFPNLSMT